MRLSPYVAALFAILLVIGGLSSMLTAQTKRPSNNTASLDLYQMRTGHDHVVMPGDIVESCLNGNGGFFYMQEVWEHRHIACVLVDGVLLAYECQHREIRDTMCDHLSWYTDTNAEDFSCQYTGNPALAELCLGSGIAYEERVLISRHIRR